MFNFNTTFRHLGGMQPVHEIIEVIIHHVISVRVSTTATFFSASGPVGPDSRIPMEALGPARMCETASSIARLSRRLHMGGGVTGRVTIARGRLARGGLDIRCRVVIISDIVVVRVVVDYRWPSNVEE